MLKNRKIQNKRRSSGERVDGAYFPVINQKDDLEEVEVHTMPPYRVFVQNFYHLVKAVALVNLSLNDLLI